MKRVYVVLEYDAVDCYLVGVFASSVDATNAVRKCLDEHGLALMECETSQPWQVNGGKTVYTDREECYYEIIPTEVKPSKYNK